LRDNAALKLTARAGLVGRGVFYVLLAGLAAGLLVGPRPSRQVNANGALTQIAAHPLGLVLLVGAALGFAAFGILRLAGAATDDRVGRWRRLSTAGQGLLYLGLAATTASFVLGRQTTGSEQQQRRAVGDALQLPGGRLVVAAAGVALLAACAWQLIVAVKGHFADTLHTEQMTAPVRWWTHVLARVGIPARAVAVLPVGVLLLVAGVRSDPGEAKGLDGLLAEVAMTGWGKALVALVAAGFLVFAAYSFLEARYRQISAGA
jgi:hypothetical protein